MLEFQRLHQVAIAPRCFSNNCQVECSEEVPLFFFRPNNKHLNSRVLKKLFRNFPKASHQCAKFLVACFPPKKKKSPSTDRTVLHCHRPLFECRRIISQQNAVNVMLVPATHMPRNSASRASLHSAGLPALCSGLAALPHSGVLHPAGARIALPWVFPARRHTDLARVRNALCETLHQVAHTAGTAQLSALSATVFRWVSKARGWLGAGARCEALNSTL